MSFAALLTVTPAQAKTLANLGEEHGQFELLAFSPNDEYLVVYVAGKRYEVYGTGGTIARENTPS